MAKAEADDATMEREARVRKGPNYDAVCFHAQQCAEKYLKGRLIESGADPGRTHDLTALLDRTVTVEPLWETFREDLALLSDFAVTTRYPGDAAARESALDARRRCRAFRLAARQALQCPDP